MIERQRCASLNSLGKQCQHAAKVGSNMCHFHDTARRRQCLATAEKTGVQCVNSPLVGYNVCSSHLGEAKKFQNIIQEVDDAPFPATALEQPTPDPIKRFLEIKDSKEFVKAVLDSQLFREYIVDGIRSRTIPPTVLMRLMDEGWGKPVDRVEHTGKDGQPIVSEVRRVVVRVSADLKPPVTRDEPIDILPTDTDWMNAH